MPCGFSSDLCRHSLPEGSDESLPFPPGMQLHGCAVQGSSWAAAAQIDRANPGQECEECPPVPHEDVLHMLQVINGVAPADMPQAEEFLSNINLSLRKSLIAIDLK